MNGRAALTSLLLLTAAACSPVRMFNAVMPHDRDAVRVVRDAAFGTDPRQRLDVYAPVRARAVSDEQRHPVLLFIYGGSWNGGAKEGYAFVARALAARGFVVAVADYRLVPQVRYPAFIEDNAAALRWLARHAPSYAGDPERMVIAGHSAGAYNAVMLALDPRWLGDDRRLIRGVIALAGPYDFLPFSAAATRAAFGAAPDPQVTQPINHVAPGAPPLFLATGARDRLVNPRNSDLLEARLRAVGVPVERRSYERLGHAGLVTTLAVPFRNRAPVLDDITAFARRVTQ